jgi:transglutaminase-like putative cysteine protease
VNAAVPSVPPFAPPPASPPPPRRYEVRHRTEYRYGDDVTSSYGWAYLTPRDLADQVCLSSQVEVSPPATLHSEVVDYFGNRASYFEVHEPHRRLVVTSTSLVEVSRIPADLGRLDRWSVAQALRLSSGSIEDVDLALTSPRLPPDPRVAAFAADLLPPERPLGQALGSLVSAIHRDFRFRPGATSVSSTLADVLERREGVCQDFAHLAVASLRWAGFSVRYVSGYLETQPPPGQPKRQGADASHAWISVLVPTFGWVDLDPTNNQAADAGYVVTAWGRDYADVPPLKGVIFTESASSEMSVGVDVVRLSG